MISWLQWLEKRWGARARWWDIAIFQLTELNIKANLILVPRAYDSSGLRQESRALARPDFLSMRRAFVSYSRLIRFDGKSVNRGLPVLDQARALGTRMLWEQPFRACAIDEGLNRMGRIRLFPLLFQNGCSSSRFLPQARRIVGSGDENGQICHVFNVRVHEGTLNDAIKYAQKGCAMQLWGITNLYTFKIIFDDVNGCTLSCGICLGQTREYRSIILID